MYKEIKNFTLREMQQSETAERNRVDNSTPESALLNVVQLMVALQGLRDKTMRVIKVNSGYRNEETNKLVGGAKNSKHMQGLAADITIPKFEGEDDAHYKEAWRVFKVACINAVRAELLSKVIFERKKGSKRWVHVEVGDTTEGIVMGMIDGKVTRSIDVRDDIVGMSIVLNEISNKFDEE